MSQSNSNRSSETTIPESLRNLQIDYGEAYTPVDFRQQGCKKQAMEMPWKSDGFTCSSIVRV